MEDQNLILTDDPNEVVDKIIDESDYSRLPELIKLFKASMAKKEVIRIIKLNQLLNRIEDKVVDRFDKTELITNSEMLDFMKVTQGSIDRANKMLSEIEGTTMPNQAVGNTINVLNLNTDKDVSNDKVAKAILAFISKAKKEEPEEEPLNEETIIEED